MNNKSKYWLNLHGAITLILIGVSLYLLLVEHTSHILPYLPFLIILLCPLMHLFMHKGHGGHGQDEHSAQSIEDAYQKGVDQGRKDVNKGN